MEILKYVCKVLQVLLIPVKVAIIVIPLIVIMVYTNYTIDSSGLYQGDVVNKGIVDLLLAGNNVTNYSQIEERSFLKEFAKVVPKEDAPEILAIGSSRVLQLREDVFDVSFYNAGMTSADFRDLMNQVYLFDREDKLPKSVIIGIDPWVFNGAEDMLERRADAELFDEFLSVALGKKTDYVPVEESEEFKKADELWRKFSSKFLEEEKSLRDYNITSETLSALFEVPYFQGNLSYKARTQTDDAQTDKEESPFNAISNEEMQDIEMEIKLADGSVFYAKSFREASEDEILTVAHAQAGTFLRMIGYTEFDTKQAKLFEEFVDYLIKKDIKVYFFLAPYHAFTYEYQSLHNMEQVSGFFEIEPYIRELAQSKNIPVIGSYDPKMIGLEDIDFFDGLHVKPEGIAKFFGGISQTGEVLPGTVEMPTEE